jgi:hypothetical protein
LHHPRFWCHSSHLTWAWCLRSRHALPRCHRGPTPHHTRLRRLHPRHARPPTTCMLRRARAGVPAPSGSSIAATFSGFSTGGACRLCASSAPCLRAPLHGSISSTTVTGTVPTSTPTPPLPPPPPRRSRV